MTRASSRPRANSRASPTSCRRASPDWNPAATRPARRYREAAAAEAAANQAVKAAGDEQGRRARPPSAPPRKDLAAAKRRGEALQTELAEAADELASLMGDRFAMAQLKPLTPEQMCWSILKVTGVYDRYARLEEAELGKAKPLAGPAAASGQPGTPARSRSSRASSTSSRGTCPRSSGSTAPGPGQPQNDFFATADQALFAANGGSINGWIAPAGGNVSERMIAEKDARKAAEDLYLTILSRPPTDEEAADVARLLAVPPRRSRPSSRSWSGDC